MTTKTLPSGTGVVSSYTYDNADRLTAISHVKGGSTTLASVAYTLDDVGNRTQRVDQQGTHTYAYDDVYRLTSVTYPGPATTSYTFDAFGNRLTKTDASGTTNSTYDDADRLTSVTDWGSNAIAYAYDDAGRLTTKTLPSGTGIVSSYTYDTADRLTGISHVKNGSTTIASVNYTLDDVGNRTQRVDQQGTHTYSYDDVYRLTSVTYPGPSTTTYGFDAFGNRTSMTVGSAQTTYAYDDADRVTTVTPPSPAPAVSYTWDNNGNLTNRGSDIFAWDYEDRMTSATVAGTSTSFTYRGDGLRNSRTTGGVTTTFTWDIARGLPVVIDDGAKYIYGAGLEAQVLGTNRYYYLADALGSTMKTVDATGTVVNAYTYDVYGKKTSSSGSQANEFDFAAQQTDPTGLQYLRARYMDPETGVFVSREPLAVRPGWTGNAHGYGGANPARFVDPTGLSNVDSDQGYGATCRRQQCTVIFSPSDKPVGDGDLIDYGEIVDAVSDVVSAVVGGTASVFLGDLTLNDVLTGIQLADIAMGSRICMKIGHPLAAGACFAVDEFLNISAALAAGYQYLTTCGNPFTQASGPIFFEAVVENGVKDGAEIPTQIKGEAAAYALQSAILATCNETESSSMMIGEKAR